MFNVLKKEIGLTFNLFFYNFSWFLLFILQLDLS